MTIRLNVQDQYLRENLSHPRIEPATTGLHISPYWSHSGLLSLLLLRKRIFFSNWNLVAIWRHIISLCLLSARFCLPMFFVCPSYFCLVNAIIKPLLMSKLTMSVTTSGWWERDIVSCEEKLLNCNYIN